MSQHRWNNGLSIMEFLAQFDYQRHLILARRALERFVSVSAPGFQRYMEAFATYTQNRFSVNIRRLTQATNDRARQTLIRRQTGLIRQINRIQELPRAETVSLFAALLMGFRESARMLFSGTNINDSWQQGGLDNLFDEQNRYRQMGVLAADVQFSQGTLFNTISPETHRAIRSATIPGSQVFLAYAGRVGYAAQRFRTLAGTYGFAVDQTGKLMQMESNFFLALTMAAQGGMSWRDFTRGAVGSGRGYGIETLLDYLRAHRLPLSAVIRLGTFRDEVYQTRQHFVNRRSQMATWMAASITAMELQYAEWLAAQVRSGNGATSTVVPLNWSHASTIPPNWDPGQSPPNR